MGGVRYIDYFALIRYLSIKHLLLFKDILILSCTWVTRCLLVDALWFYFVWLTTFKFVIVYVCLTRVLRRLFWMSIFGVFRILGLWFIWIIVNSLGSLLDAAHSVASYKQNIIFYTIQFLQLSSILAIFPFIHPHILELSF